MAALDDFMSTLSKLTSTNAGTVSALRRQVVTAAKAYQAAVAPPPPPPPPPPEPPPPTPEPPPPTPTGPVFLIDDFTGTTLDTNTWCTRYYWPGTEYGLGERGEIVLAEQVSLHDGTLDIWAHRQQTTNPGNTADVRPYRSGVITTGMTQQEGKPARLSWQYGLLEVRAKFPKGLGYEKGYWTAAQSKMWPAIWVLAADGKVNDTDSPEIDMLDLFGDSTFGQFAHSGGRIVPGPYGGQWKPDRISNPGGLLRYNGAEHWDSTWSGPPWPPRVELGDDWHTFGLNWVPGRIEFLLDGVVHGTNTTNVPAKPYYLLVNLAVGHRSGFWPPGAETPDDAHFLVDWVRLTRYPETKVYRRGVEV